MKANFSPLLTQYLAELEKSAHKAGILDLACGSGRNGLYLVERGLPVTFADKSTDALEEIGECLTADNYSPGRELAQLWPVNFELANTSPLTGKTFGAVLVFRYLHRPLMPGIKNCIAPGGMIIYETFTLGQREFGRPRRDEFLLKPEELASYFADWQILHSFEGVVPANNEAGAQAIAQLVAIKPEV